MFLSMQVDIDRLEYDTSVSLSLIRAVIGVVMCL